MRESTLRRLLNLLPVGRAFGLVLFGIGLGIAVTPYLVWGRPPIWNRDATFALCLGIVCFAVSVVAERQARRLLGERRAFDTPS
jgi:hypothetical protein